MNLKIYLKKYQKNIKDKFILDPFNILEKTNLSKKNKIISLGRYDKK